MLIALFALLFAQMSVAAHVCPPAAWQGPGAGTAIDCATMAGELDSAAPNLCGEHCQSGQKGDQPRLPAVPAVALVALYALPFSLALTAPMMPAAESRESLIAPSPPHTILHCCLRI
ncbi:MAG: hypothetical protein ABI580_04750 [Burkholderiaceae bacterium]